MNKNKDYRLNIKKYLITSIKNWAKKVEVDQIKVLTALNDLNKRFKSINIKTDTKIIIQLKEEHEILTNSIPSPGWEELEKKAYEFHLLNYPDISKNEISLEVKKNINQFKFADLVEPFSMAGFRKRDRIYQKLKRAALKAEKLKSGVNVMTYSEMALHCAKVKRDRSFNIVNNIFNQLMASGAKKITAAAIYEVVKAKYNDCIKPRNISYYLKEIKLNNSVNINLNDNLDINLTPILLKSLSKSKKII